MRNGPYLGGTYKVLVEEVPRPPYCPNTLLDVDVVMLSSVLTSTTGNRGDDMKDLRGVGVDDEDDHYTGFGSSDFTDSGIGKVRPHCVKREPQC